MCKYMNFGVKVSPVLCNMRKNKDILRQFHRRQVISVMSVERKKETSKTATDLFAELQYRPHHAALNLYLLLVSI